MGWNDNFGGCDISYCRVVCSCGAVYEIRESDGVPGCRDIESVDCVFCGKELARHYGECDGRLIDDSAVDVDLKQAMQKKR